MKVKTRVRAGKGVPSGGSTIEIEYAIFGDCEG